MLHSCENKLKIVVHAQCMESTAVQLYYCTGIPRADRPTSRASGDPPAPRRGSFTDTADPVRRRRAAARRQCRRRRTRAAARRSARTLGVERGRRLPPLARAVEQGRGRGVAVPREDVGHHQRLEPGRGMVT